MMTLASSINLKLHLLMMLESSFKIVTCLYNKPLYYKHTAIINYASSVINKLEALFTYDARVVIYNCHVFKVQATGACTIKLFAAVIYGFYNKLECLSLTSLYSLV